MVVLTCQFLFVDGAAGKSVGDPWLSECVLCVNGTKKSKLNKYKSFVYKQGSLVNETTVPRAKKVQNFAEAERNQKFMSIHFNSFISK